MKKKIAALLLCFGLFLCSSSSFAVWEPPIEVEAASYYLINLDTDTVILEENADEPRAVASLTKMITSLLLLESGEDLDTLITVPDRLQGEFQHIASENGARLELKIGEEISLRDLLYCTLLPSCNDTASTIADYLGDGNTAAFVEQMNARAAELGCTSTHFTCPHGLYDADNYSTAHDLALIAKACMENGTFREVVTTSEFWLPMTNMHTVVQTSDAPEGMYLKLGSTIRLQDKNSPVYRTYAKGVKTGFTDAAGRCLVTTAEDESGHYLLVLLGMPNRKDDNGIFKYFNTAAALLDWTYDNFTLRNLDIDTVPVAEVPLEYCEDSKSLSIYADGTLTDILEYSEEPIAYDIEIPESIAAPVNAGDILGHLTVTMGGNELGQFNLISKDDRSMSLRIYWGERLSSFRITAKLLFALAALIVLGLVLALIFLIVLFVRSLLHRRRRTVQRRRKYKYVRRK